MNSTSSNRVETWLKIVSPLLAIAAFLWGIYTYRDAARQQLERTSIEADHIAQTRRIEATRPYLDTQLALYIEATQVTAIIATSKDEKEVEENKQRFRELYWGELALVEHGKVIQAMIAFHVALDSNKEQSELARLALNLAHACREELAISWGVDNWRTTQPTSDVTATSTP